MGRESRLHRRVLARLPAELGTAEGEGWSRALVHDLSVSGAGLLTTAPLGVRVELRLRFGLPEEGGEDVPIELSCLVMRTGRLAVPDDAFQFFSGLHFLPLSDQTHERLKVYIWANRELEIP
jgi:hypothetical protein